MLIDPFVVRAGLCMLKSDPVFLIQVKVICLIINTRCSFPVFIETFFFIYGYDKTFCYPWINQPISLKKMLENMLENILENMLENMLDNMLKNRLWLVLGLALG